MNGREQMKAARAKALGRERHPARETHDGQSNKYALEPTLISMGVGPHRSFLAQYKRDPMVERLGGRRHYWSMSERGRMRQLKIHIRETLDESLLTHPLPLP
jgi:hypothetical protein